MKPDLRAVATSVLELAAKRLEARAGDEAPIDLAEVRAWGLGDAGEALVDELGGFTRSEAVLSIRAVLNERASRTAARPELVWTGTSPAKDARDTRVLLKQLFASAQRSVLVAGYSFDHGGELFAPLHASMRDRGVDARFYINIEQDTAVLVPAESVARQVARFLATNWPFGDPQPAVYYDERILTDGIYASLHAKCVVVDERLALVTSSNFTERGQRRNIEVGVLLEDAAFAASLAANFRAGRFARAAGA